ncbi:hypothetical protein [Candidatus Uabimicrobium sp. HlEnr_7]|uniref:hypothetical protein n=1 Tax=Candidatus Uabimicrobium helgolandensis TaxID=3095367 RepID=UPI0035579337
MRLVLLVILVVLIGCDSNTAEVEALRKSIEEIKISTENMVQETEGLHKELRETWKNSLRYRFPNIRQIAWGREMHNDLPDLDYLATINFISNKKRTLKLIFNYKTEKEKVRPHFFIYIFDSRGINIHKQEVRYKAFWNHYLKKDNLTPQTVKLKLPVTKSTPTYFLLKEISS